MTDLEAYSPEYEGLFVSLQNRARAGEGPSDEEILCIVKWKLGRLKDSHFRIVHEKGEDIRSSVLQAGHPDKETRMEAVRGLIGIRGIKLALASAILTACWPEYTVLDWRALEELKEAACHIAPWPTKSDVWAKDVDGYFDRYLPAVECFRQKKHLQDLRQADRALWGRSVRRQIRTGLGLE